MWHLCSGPGHVGGKGRPDQTMADSIVAAKVARSVSGGTQAAVCARWREAGLPGSTWDVWLDTEGGIRLLAF